MAYFNEGFIKQWWDRSDEARAKNRTARQQKEEEKKKEEEREQKDEHELKKYGIITQKEFDICFGIVKKQFLSSRKLGYASTFKPSEYESCYLIDKNDFIRLGFIDVKDYHNRVCKDPENPSEQEEKAFKKLLNKIDKKVNNDIAEANIKNITFRFSEMEDNIYMFLDSTKPKRKKKEDNMEV